MRNKLIAILLLIFSTGVWAADGPAAATNGFSKADFRNEVATPKLRKLLGVSGGNLYVALQDGSVEVVNKEGKTVMALAAKSGDIELLRKPEAATVANETIYVVDSKTDQVVMYDLSTGKYLGRFGSKAGGSLSGAFALDEPQGVAVYEGVVYVADTSNERIQMFGINGVFLSTLKLSPPASNGAQKEKVYKLG
jgi:DNA-binding beta-propeller fold protein YncE